MELKALIAANPLNLPEEKQLSLQNQLARGQLSFLSPDKEGSPFLLYFMGASIEEVAAKTSLPVDVILATAMKYDWLGKAQAMRRDSVLSGMELVKENILRTLLVATQVKIEKELADMFAGRPDAKESALLPKNIHGLRQLLDMVNELNPKPKEDPKAPIQVGVQVNLTSGDKPTADVQVLDVPKSKLPPGII